ncbi:PREDICTED: sulfhydryl oxidase 2-like isoform X2 [Nelumbo nucifera]|uniref:Sulfhydryl oxidase n=1 Tax=Nelumbo nucifera TaxID=4432 RepID=A0A1U8A099_NELNU|nr:PREDICTED: sulfhydryl oxidase 2-like isoform X2 [Nelumbo nucifera]
MSPFSIFLPFLLYLSFGVSSVPIGSRSILRALGDPDPPDAAIDLNTTSFDEVLRDSPASFAIVEYFAHWCPACRNYKPQYEKVARIFNGADAAHPGIIIMARVDCALKVTFFSLVLYLDFHSVKRCCVLKLLTLPSPQSQINIKLCDRFSVGHYPMLLWGPPAKFASGGWEPKKEKSEILAIDDGRTSERLLEWINKKMGSSYSLDDEKYENENLPLNASDPGQIARALYDVEEATWSAFDIIFEHKMIKSETRDPLIRFLQLLVAHHPSRRCRKGSAEILLNFDDLWPSDLWPVNIEKNATYHGNDAFKGFQICGKEIPRGYWIFCRGSKNETRGYSCGLWVLLHSLSVRLEDGESHIAFTAICDFIHNFFICQECRRHFYEMCSTVSYPFNKTSQFALWLWDTHNKVNERLKKEEESLGTGDPKFPKMLWPPKQLCPSCYRSLKKKSDGTSQVEWNLDAVFKFLVGYYGNMLVSSYKDNGLLGVGGNERSLVDDMATSTSAVAVPVGAALGIALASCAFGALACVWRSQQKNRKRRRN